MKGKLTFSVCLLEMISGTIFLFQTIVEKVTTIAVRHGPMGSKQRGTMRSGLIKHVVWLHQLAP